MAQKNPLYIIYKDANQIEHEIFFDIVTDINHVSEAVASEFPLEDGTPMSDHVIVLPANLNFVAWVTNSPLLDNPGVAANSRFGQGNIPYPLINPKIIFPTPLQYPAAKSPTLASISSVANLAGGLQAVKNAVGLGDDYRKQPTGRQPITAGQSPGNQPAGFFPVLPVDRIGDMYKLLNLVQTSKFLCEIHTPERVYTNIILTNINAPRKVDNGDAIEFNISAKEIRRVTLKNADVPIPASAIAAYRKASGSKNAAANAGQNAQNAQLASQTGSENPHAAKEKIVGDLSSDILGLL